MNKSKKSKNLCFLQPFGIKLL